jgi:hypothetical protein
MNRAGTALPLWFRGRLDRIRRRPADGIFQPKRIRIYPLSFFAVDILALTTMFNSMCIGTRNARAAGQASPRRLPHFTIHPSKFSIRANQG